LTTNLRLLLDEAITNVLADEIKRSSSAINVEYIRDLPIKGAKDPGVIAYAKQTDRIVVTTESGMNHKTFPICTHPGIIVLCGRRRHESFHAGVFQRFLLSGNRKLAREAVTFLSEREMRIQTHADEITLRLE